MSDYRPMALFDLPTTTPDVPVGPVSVPPRPRKPSCGRCGTTVASFPELIAHAYSERVLAPVWAAEAVS